MVSEPLDELCREVDRVKAASAAVCARSAALVAAAHDACTRAKALRRARWHGRYRERVRRHLRSSQDPWSQIARSGTGV